MNLSIALKIRSGSIERGLRLRYNEAGMGQPFPNSVFAVRSPNFPAFRKYVLVARSEERVRTSKSFFLLVLAFLSHSILLINKLFGF
jgi:hypothetical protein